MNDDNFQLIISTTERLSCVVPKIARFFIKYPRGTGIINQRDIIVMDVKITLSTIYRESETRTNN